MSPANSSSRQWPVPPEAARLFEELAVELEEGRGDPEALFAAHPALEGELRELYRGWLEADALFRSMAGDESLVGSVRREIEAGLAEGGAEARAGTILGRLAETRFAERYALGEVLGRGGMGEVRRVTDRVLGRELAMKVIRPVEPGRRARLLLRFLEEAEVIGRLEHPGIVPIHELGLDAEGQVYFTMPLVRGHTLAAVLGAARAGREGWSVARVLEVLLRVAETLAYAHSRGVLHRDLKPANVMVGPFGEVYVMDWGLARSLGGAGDSGGAVERGGVAEALGDGPLTLAGEVLGTPAYMAPEQARGSSAALDERCDVYALGAILYEVVAGARPYGERSSAEALALLERAPPPELATLAPGVNEELASIVQRAMAREREARYASVADLAADLRAHLEGRVVRAHRTGPWVEARKWLGRNRRLAGALGLAAAALVAGLVVTSVLLARAEHERANVLRLSLGRTLEGLVAEARALWPAHPERIDDMEDWLVRARALVQRLEPDPESDEPGLSARLARELERPPSDSEEERWWREQLEELVAEIRAFDDPATGLTGRGWSAEHGFGVEHRRERAAALAARAAAPEVAERWEATCADVAADARYGGIRLVPQVGLVPLGRDPESKLFEFAHLLSGSEPGRDAGGRLVIGPETGLVLVLVPAGEFLAGSQDTDPGAPNYIAHRHVNERPVACASVGAFLVSKHEVTQAQWRRAVGDSPSYFREMEGAELLPVEQVDWNRARVQLEQLGLRLPTEAEWEYGCRAGTQTKFHWGDESELFPRYANVRDRSYAPFLTSAEDPVELLDDGFATVAPIGRFRPNAWGLHDMHGNVFEWCEDLVAQPGLDPKVYRDRSSRVFRGGAYHRMAEEAHCARPSGEIPSYSYRAIGVRPARSLDP